MRIGSETTGNIQQVSSGFLGLASGNTAQRPSTLTNGMLRYNTDFGAVEFYQANNWSNNTTTSGVIGKGQILFNSTSNGNVFTGNSSLFWDNVNLRLGLGTSSPQYQFDIQNGASPTVGRIGTVGDTNVISTGTGVILSQTGDVYGGSSVQIMNRYAYNGLSLTTNSISSSLSVVDLVYTGNVLTTNSVTNATSISNSVTRYIRMDTRTSASSYKYVGSPSFHIGGASPDTPALAVGDSVTYVSNTIYVQNSINLLSTGSPSSPAIQLVGSGEYGTGLYAPYANSIFLITAGGPNSNGAQVAMQTAAGYPSFFINSTDSCQIPIGNTAQRNTLSYSGTVRYNTDNNQFENYSYNQWIPQGGFSYASNPGIGSNSYYGSALDQNSIGSASFSTGFIYAAPFNITPGIPFDRVGCSVNTASSTTGATARLAIYSNQNFSTFTNLGYPYALVADLGTVSITSTGDKEISVSSASYNWSIYGWFWICIQFSATVTMVASTASPNFTPSAILGRASSTGSAYNALSAISTYGSYPSSFPTASGFSGSVPFIWVRNV